MKSVMYHYVREWRSDLPYFRYLHIENFRKQLDYFVENFCLPTQAEFLECLKTKQCIKDAIFLTFDDGLRDHFDYVLPELEKRDLWGIFYVPTGPLSTGEPLTVHIIHRLLGAYGGTNILEALMRFVQPFMLKQAHVEEFQRLTYPDQEDDAEATTTCKRILNYFIATEWQRAVIDQLITEFSLESFDDLYLSKDQVAEIHARGNLIGSHSVTHPLFSKLSYDEQKTEILDSFAHLEDVIGKSFVKTFCYPYGGFHSFTPDTEKLLSEAGCDFSFNVEYREIESHDIDERPQALPRFDCNLFPYGKAS
jgi:peptidoglycan/xylan/chitin deacetylase (PgdA/CDA1 family)